MNAIAGVDYSTRAVHAAIVEDKRLVFVKQYDLGASPLGPIGVMVADLKARGVERLYQEKPFMIPPRYDKVKQKIVNRSGNATLGLHRAANQVETLATLAGLTVELVAPATWQSAILTGVPGATTKERSLWFVRRVWSLALTDANKADAICIATYGEALVRLKGLIPPPLEVV